MKTRCPLPFISISLPARKTLLFVLAVPLLGGTPLLAQTGDEEEEPMFDLPEFVVDASEDRGYTVTNSMTGTFLDTPLKDSPFAIDVYTPDMIGDTGSTDMREILAYDSGLQLENTIAAQEVGEYGLGTEFDPRGIENNETDIVTRGFRAPTLKNGFFTQTRVDTVNIGRVERAGGPQSLLYGIGAISGITNIITKRPLPEPRYTGQVFVGNNSFYRATAEATGPLWETDTFKLDYIFSAAGQTEETEIPHEKEESLFFAPAFQLRAFEDKTKIYLSFEEGWRKQYGTGRKDANMPDGFVGVIDPDTGQPNEDGLRITGDTAKFLRDYLDKGYYVNLGGPDAWVEDDVLSASVEITQQIGKHFRLLASVNRDEQDRDEQLFTRTPSVEGISVDDLDLRYAFGRFAENRVTEQARVALLGSFEAFGGRHSLVVGRQEFSQRREYEDQDDKEVTDVNFWPLDGSSIRYQGEEYTNPDWKDFGNEWYQGNYVIYQGSLWNGKINPVIGYRWDRSHTRLLRSDFDEESGTFESAKYDFTKEERNSRDGYANAGQPFEQETPTLGLSVAISDNLSVYGAYAEGIALANAAQVDGNGEGFAPEFTRSRELGVKGTFWDGRISGRVTYFELEKRGGVRYSFYAPAPYKDNFNPDEPITAALLANSEDRPKDFRKFIAFLGVYDLETGESSVSPEALPGVERVMVEEDGDENIYYIFPFGDAENPGSYDPETNTAPNGYGEQLLAFIEQEQQEFGVGQDGSPQYMWAEPGNHPGEDRGAYHNYDERSQGYEVRLSVTPIDNWQMVFSYTYNTVMITSGLSGLADPEVITGMEPWYWYLPKEVFADSLKPSTYSGSLSEGVRNTDVPVHSFTLWTKYEFTDGWLEGLDLRFGARYTSERAAEAPWAREKVKETSRGDFADAIHRGAGDNVKAFVPAYTLYDVGAGYTWNWKDIEWKVNVNIRNLFDETRLTAETENTYLFREYGQPELTEFWLDGREIRVSLRAAF